MVSFFLFKPTSIHSAKCPVIAMIFRVTTMKLQLCKSKYSLSFFWFQVRAKNNIHNQFKSGASKHTNKYLIYNIIVFTSEDTEGKCLKSKFLLTCVLKNVTWTTMHNARFFSLKSAIPFLKVKKYIYPYFVYM